MLVEAFGRLSPLFPIHHRIHSNATINRYNPQITGIEGTLFATLMSVFNGAGALGSELGALLTSVLGVTESNFENLGLLVTICNFSSLLSLPFLSLLGKAGDTGEAETEMDEGETGA